MISRLLAALILTLALGGAAEAAARRGGTPVPAAATAAGYKTLTFSTMVFNTSNVDMSKTYASGFQWYPWNFFGATPDATTVTLNSNGSTTLLGNATISQGILATAGKLPSSPFFVGTAFGGGFYVEAELSFRASTVNTAKGWPSWWSMAIEHLDQQTTTDQWAGQAPGYEHFIEYDFFEYDTAFLTVPNQYGGTLHDWFGIFNSTCPPAYCAVTTPFSTANRVVPAGTDFALFHRYGALWIPATGSANGMLAFFFDDVQIGPATLYSQFTTQAPPPTLTTPWTWGVIDQQHLALILGAGTSSPVTVRSVHAWQASAANNLTN